MKNIFILSALFLLGAGTAIFSAGYVVEQNRIAQEDIKKGYVESLETMKSSLSQEKKDVVKVASTVKPAVKNPAITKPAGDLTPPVVSSPSPSKTLAGLRLADVATHSAQSDCWIIISGSVYSVTSYISMHPGGSRRIINVCGQDATSEFEGIQGGRGHSNYANSLLNQYLVGTL